MGAFDLLSRQIRQYIYAEGWPALTKIQQASIQYIMNGKENLILSAPTASGKTEAAFLPVLSTISDFKDGVKILYISPLIALINDQFTRISRLCRHMDIEITRWHSEVSSSKKRKLAEKPSGILLITPESLEALFDLHPEEVCSLFEKTEYAIIDEIHSFLGNARGYQLKSLLERMQQFTSEYPRYIGMSATLSQEDAKLVKEFFHNNRKTLILADRSRKEIESTLHYFRNNRNDDALLDAARQIFRYSKKESMLVFSNSRHNTETMATTLQEMKKEYGSDTAYFAHYSNLSKEIKHEAETFAKESRGRLFTICCTSTLELGIDIGSVDAVVQYGGISSSSSLAQRLGRSGRRGQAARLHLMSGNPYDFFQSLAALELIEKGVTDSIKPITHPYDVFAHQLLAYLYENNGMDIDLFRGYWKNFKCWEFVDDAVFKAISNYMLKQGYMEKVDHEVIVSQKMEKQLSRGSFFCMFDTEGEWTIYHEQHRLAQMPIPPHIHLGSHFFLAGSSWEIKEMDTQKHRIEVIPTTGGTGIKIGSGKMPVSAEVRSRMRELILEEDLDFHDPEIKTALKATFNVKRLAENPLIVEDDDGFQGIQTFASTAVNLTLGLLLELVCGVSKVEIDEFSSVISFHRSELDALECIEMILDNSISDGVLFDYFKENQDVIDRYMENVKYKNLLPVPVRVQYILNNVLDLDGTLDQLRFIHQYPEYLKKKIENRA